MALQDTEKILQHWEIKKQYDQMHNRIAIAKISASVFFTILDGIIKQGVPVDPSKLKAILTSTGIADKIEQL